VTEQSGRVSHYLHLFARAQFLRFLIVGGINTAFAYGVFALALYAGFHYALASLTSIVLGMFFSFFTQGKLVFKSNKPGELARFLAVATLLYFVHTGLLKAAAYFGIDLYLAGAALTFPLSLLSYVLNKHLVFRHAVRPN
jgi:putative flippase GtrA